MVQEVLPGGVEQKFAYGAFCKNGRPVGSMTVRRRRQHPPQFGRASTYVETVAARVRQHHDAGADHVAVQVLRGDREIPLSEWRELARALL